jgi:hypothetical protein
MLPLTNRFFRQSLVPMIVKQHQRSLLHYRSTTSMIVSSSSSLTSSSPSPSQQRYFSDEGPKQRVVKVKKKKRETKTETSSSGRPRDLQILLDCLDAPNNKPPPPTDEEEMKRRDIIQKNYTVGKFKQHNAENHDLACQMRMKKHAINMLPKKTALKEKALIVDNNNFPPRWRAIPAWTPPIKNFNPSEYMITEE